MNFLRKVLNRAMVAFTDHYYRRFVMETTRARETNEMTLQRILQLNRETEFGRKYNFANIRTAADYKAAVPLSSYDDYADAIEQMAARNTPNLLTSQKVEYFAFSSGTTGRQKLIPVTSSSLQSAAQYMGMLPLAILRRCLGGKLGYGRGLSLIGMSVSGYTEGGIPKSTATAGGMRAMKPMIPMLWTSPLEILQPDGKMDTTYLHLLFALKEKDLAYISAPFISAILDLCRRLEQDWPRLVQDITVGGIHPEIEISGTDRTKLSSRLTSDPVRAKELTDEFERGFQGILPRIWPELGYIMSVGGGGFQVYTEKLRHYTGHLPVYSGFYGATESPVIGVSMELDHFTFVVAPGASFFEFIPLAEIDNPEVVTLSLEELETGESYEVVVTSYNGLYRYRMGDIVKVTGYCHQSPVIEFLYRRNQLLNIVGEKTSEQAVLHALRETFWRLNFDWVDFTAITDTSVSPGKYIFYVEGKNSVPPRMMERMKKQLDDEICRANPFYEYFRKGEKIASAEICLVLPQTFRELRKLLLERGASENQLKIPRVLWDERLIAFMDSRIFLHSERMEEETRLG